MMRYERRHRCRMATIAIVFYDCNHFTVCSMCIECHHTSYLLRCRPQLMARSIYVHCAVCYLYIDAMLRFGPSLINPLSRCLPDVMMHHRQRQRHQDKVLACIRERYTAATRENAAKAKQPTNALAGSHFSPDN